LAKRMLKLVWKLLLIVSIGASSAWPMQVGGVQMTDHLKLEGRELVLNGMGVRRATIFGISIYIGGLYLEKPSTDPNQILNSPEFKRVEMHFVRDVAAHRIRNAWEEALDKNAGADRASLQPTLVKLQGLIGDGDIKKGQTVSFNFLPGRLELLIDG